MRRLFILHENIKATREVHSSQGNQVPYPIQTGLFLASSDGGGGGGFEGPTPVTV